MREYECAPCRFGFGVAGEDPHLDEINETFELVSLEKFGFICLEDEFERLRGFVLVGTESSLDAMLCILPLLPRICIPTYGASGE